MGTVIAYRNLVFNSSTMIIMCLYYISHEFMSRLACRKRPTIVKRKHIYHTTPSAARRLYCIFTAPSSALDRVACCRIRYIGIPSAFCERSGACLIVTILDGPHDANYICHDSIRSTSICMVMNCCRVVRITRRMTHSMQRRRLLLIFIVKEVDIASLPLLSFTKIILQ